MRRGVPDAGGIRSGQIREARQIIAAARAEGREGLLETEALSILGLYGIPAARHRLARGEEEALDAAQVVGFPAVLKVVSPHIVHKSDVGGVRTGLTSERALRAAHREMREEVERRAPGAAVRGLLVAEQLSGVEVIVGGRRDGNFGPVVMFGIGGVYVEILEDVVFRLVPLRLRDAREMMEEVRGSRLLDGYRGAPAADRNALAALLVRVGELLAELPEIDELDLNPVFAGPEGGRAADARICLGRPPAAP